MCKAFSLATPIPTGGTTRDQRMHEHGPDGGGNQRWHPGQANQPRRELHKIRPRGHKSMLVQTILIRNGADRADTPPPLRYTSRAVSHNTPPTSRTVGAISDPDRSPHRRWSDGPNRQMARAASGTGGRGTLRPLPKRRTLVAEECPPPFADPCSVLLGRIRLLALFSTLHGRAPTEPPCGPCAAMAGSPAQIASNINRLLCGDIALHWRHDAGRLAAVPQMQPTTISAPHMRLI